MIGGLFVIAVAVACYTAASRYSARNGQLALANLMLAIVLLLVLGFLCAVLHAGRHP
jgi:ABC-type phosphate transport system permease subunit